MENKNRTNGTLASDVIATLEKQCQRLERLAISAIVALSLVILGLLAVNFQHAKSSEEVNHQWLEYLSQYDYVSQNGDGYNYLNSGIGGNVLNGIGGVEE